VRALVTGGAGFIGSAVSRLLIAEGWDVRIFDNLLTGFERNIPPEAEFLRGDLRSAEEASAACRGVDVVFHQGAVRSVPKSVDDPRLSHESNITGTLNILEASRLASVRRLVYASSSSVYGESEETINRETHVPNPQSPYAVTKLAGEYYCRVWTALGRLSTVSLRYFNVFGPGQHPESKYAAIFPAFVTALAAERAPEVHWDGQQSRDFTFVEDVARANLLAATANDRVDGGVLNIGAGRPKTVMQVLESVSEAIGRSIDPVFLPKRAGDVRRTHADISKARELLGYQPQTDWPGAVAATVQGLARAAGRP
jgi:UDP-N-acetylglucosamine/UDP-N-acetyl-alpha-D-glucosaminouronate 4-epimerase